MGWTFREGARRVRAKVYVAEVAGVAYGPWGDKPPEATGRERVTFRFVNGNDPDNENSKFWDATPEAQPIEMTIANPGAQGIFKPGQEYYLDFVEAIREAVPPLKE